MAEGTVVLIGKLADKNATGIRLLDHHDVETTTAAGSGASMKQTLLLTAGGGTPTTTAGCAAVAKVEAGTNDVDYHVLDFDTSTQEYAFWGPIIMPENYDLGAITAKFHWTAASGSGTVVWGIQILSLRDDDPIDTAWPTVTKATADTLIAAGDVHITAETAAHTPAGTIASGNLTFIRVQRTVADDSLGVDARLLCVRLEYGISALSA